MISYLYIALYRDIQYSLLHDAATFVIAKTLFSAGFHCTYSIKLSMFSKLFGLLFMLTLSFAISAQTFTHTNPTDSTVIVTEVITDDDGSSTSTVSTEMSEQAAIDYLYDIALDSDQRAAQREQRSQDERIRSNRAGRLITEINPDTTYQQMLNKNLGSYFDGAYIFRSNTVSNRIQIENGRFDSGETRIILIPINHLEFRLRNLEDDFVVFQRIKDNIYRATTENDRYILRKL